MSQIRKTPKPHNIRTVCLRFNMDKSLHKKAFEFLKSMDKSAFKSYTQAAAMAITEYFERYFKRCDDPYFETREREERFIEQIVAAVGSAVEKALPGFMAAYLTSLAQPYQQSVPSIEQEPDLSEIDLDFVGE